MIENSGRPRARLVAMPAAGMPAPDDPYRSASGGGRCWISDDFDAPWPEEIRRALEGEPDPDDPLDVDATAPR